MAKFSQIQKSMRATIQDRKRAAHGDPHTRKLKQKPEPIPISGKRKRKLFKKWRREKKAAIENGLVTMEDVEMSVADELFCQGDTAFDLLSVKMHPNPTLKGNSLLFKHTGKCRYSRTIHARISSPSGFSLSQIYLEFKSRINFQSKMSMETWHQNQIRRMP
ncbi:hypothetical protein KSP40_PGU011918 [Platanthera guangdongensis]|uniref:Uncharacterized protein n=1 Tax=Platanthera guangdongensis TaxID=2320717 RepID=A0ABR2LQW2_9ASPA